MFATSLALLAQAFPPRERGVAFGVFGAVTGVAVAVGPVLGGAITSGLKWRWIFFVNVPIGVVALAITLRASRESRAARTRRGPTGPASSPSASALGRARVRTDPQPGRGLGVAQVLGSLSRLSLLLVAFVVIECACAQPMLDLSLLRVPTFNGGLVAAWAISASIFSLLTYLVHLPPEPPRLLGDRRRPALPAAHRRGVPDRRHRRTADDQGPDPVADRRRASRSSAPGCC